VKEVILSRLKDIEKEHDIKILYACESGSRTWGFESKDSDWDVRFIYTHSLPWYMSVSRMNNVDMRDCIEYPLEEETNLDINGWDLSKALYLLYKSNCPLIEWLNTPLIYKKNTEFYIEIRNLTNKLYSRSQALYHYYHMTNRNINEYLKDKNIVWTKKYIYILRTLLACIWIEKYSEPIPVKFQDLICMLSSCFNNEENAQMFKLLSDKINGAELGREPKNVILNGLIYREIDKIKNVTLDKFKGNRDNDKSALKDLDMMFFKYAI